MTTLTPLLRYEYKSWVFPSKSVTVNAGAIVPLGSWLYPLVKKTIETKNVSKKCFIFLKVFVKKYNCAQDMILEYNITMICHDFYSKKYLINLTKYYSEQLNYLLFKFGIPCINLSIPLPLLIICIIFRI
jgi:hypothetical protein